MYRYTLAALALIAGATAQNSTIPLPLIAFDQQEILASIIGSDSDKTTYSLSCATSEAVECGVPPSFTVTAGPSTVHYAMTVDTDDLPDEESVSLPFTGRVGAEIECKLTGTTMAVCTGTADVEHSGGSENNSATTTITDASSLGYVTVTVTAGAEETGGAAQTSNPAMPMITANARWAIGAAAALAYGAM